jgi:hypothetical protein
MAAPEGERRTAQKPDKRAQELSAIEMGKRQLAVKLADDQAQAVALLGKRAPARLNTALDPVVATVAKGMLGAVVAAPILGEAAVERSQGMEMAALLIADLRRDLAPQSALEQMMLEQLVVCQAQFLRAHSLMGRTTNVEDLEKLGQVASRMQTDFRKTVAALREMRSPAPNVYARQVNMAHQQVIQNGTTELGSEHA